MTDPISANRSDTKEAIRAEAAARVGELTTQARHDLSSRACLHVAETGAFRRAGVVLLYMPMPSEVDVTPLVLRCFQLGKTVCVPRTEWKERHMIAVEIHSMDDREMTTKHGVREPIGGIPVSERDIDLVVVPAAAFDTHARRLGRGGGFYDRFLSRPKLRAITIGIGFEAQVFDRIPTESHDVPLDMVVTDQRTIHRDGPTGGCR
ncbi:MAG: 5-formyltetrahydrofolate cyclo-ligase [Phycisphaerales bacterium]|nr:5-formyltetrahydrofolate cyclo-ligase [Phycisphaerales bacterium]